MSLDLALFTFALGECLDPGEGHFEHSFKVKVEGACFLKLMLDRYDITTSDIHMAIIDALQLKREMLEKPQMERVVTFVELIKDIEKRSTEINMKRWGKKNKDTK